ncbi:unnamed protein product [Musa acuminata subsp. burmannicoides]|uniref:(wild Malaysian banana) hypothetical protein n=1 Tax=Musa acuminata subsp. malaccensis TaxID=214687 RepID=A0A804I4P0_MUSAM|nr:PREDICTED: uncharacterized protein LOC103976208 [Musa acuminata subsp. malaccensis]XP_018676848.1 PREDICTED: uncharacterized protein LOC103976208 [Musa acuminata subsp. malaccensis]XP_018676850.1 PREDICTED: uncharacterized protein LOC103976208 [Musa acuminata subsp. malaccensis]CAG1862567.1 unnamed protein product [Musa acuminata subsp. malaccensis]
MNAGDTDGNISVACTFGEQQVFPMLPVVTDDIMARRLKNRERQRRYRARKRLESDMKRSCLLGQHTALENETQVDFTTLHFNSGEISFPSETNVNIASMMTEACVYSGRKWKKDAREAHASKEPENMLHWSLVHMRSPSESETAVCYRIHQTSRRNWKADARTKSKTGSHG